MSKKAITIIIIGFITIALILGGVYIYNTYFQPTPVAPTFKFKSFPPTEGEITTPRPPIETPAITQKKGELSVLVSEPILGGTLSRDEQNAFYITRENGNIYRISFDGKEKVRLSNTTILGIYEAQWNPDKTKVFLSYERNGEIKKIILDLSSSSSVSSIIPLSTNSLAWSSDGKTLTLADQISSGIRLISGNAIGQKGKEIAQIPLGDLQVLPNANDSIYLTEPPSGLVQGPLFRFTQKTGALSEIEKGFGLSARPSPRGEKVLISETDQNGGLLPLKIITTSTGSQTIVQVRTLAEKCAWQDETVFFCGVPDSIPNGIMPDDYYKGTARLSDILLRIDIGKQEVASFDVSGFDMQDLFTSVDGKNVFFRDQKTDYLYRFALP